MCVCVHCCVCVQGVCVCVHCCVCVHSVCVCVHCCVCSRCVCSRCVCVHGVCVHGVCVCTLDGLNEEYLAVCSVTFTFFSNKILLMAHIWLPAAALIKMSPRSAFAEIWLYRATAHILSAAVLAPPYQYTVQHHKHSHQ